MVDYNMLKEKNPFDDTTPVVMENWATIGYEGDTHYTPPEHRTLHIRGDALNHPNREGERGKNTRTSPIKDAKGRFIKCVSRVYWVGEPEHGFREFLKIDKPNWDAENPIVMINRS